MNERPERAVPSRKKGQVCRFLNSIEEDLYAFTLYHTNLPQRNIDPNIFKQQRAQKKREKKKEKAKEAAIKKNKRGKLLSELATLKVDYKEQSLYAKSSQLGHVQTRKEEHEDDLVREAILNPTQRKKLAPSQPRRKRQRSSKEGGVEVVEQEESSSGSEMESEEEGEETTPPLNKAQPVIPINNPVLVEVSTKKETLTHIPQEIEPRLAIPKLTQQVKFVVRPDRTDEVKRGRSGLPVCGMEREIMEAIEDNPVVILCGETGSGKTTQVPQFLFEAGYADSRSVLHSGLIGVTQPRRVAATSMAQRVGKELNAPDLVGYQIRYDSTTVSKHTKIKFMTDGILLREAKEDLILRKYSCILLDEAHERNLNTDLILGILSRVVALRQTMFEEGVEEVTPLKLVIMSATLRVHDFTKPGLFAVPPPVIQVEARQFPVKSHFAKITNVDGYLEEAFNKVCAIHRKLPPGGILVFLTGQREIEWFTHALKTKFPALEVEEREGEENMVGEDEEDMDFSDLESEGEEEGDIEGEEDVHTKSNPTGVMLEMDDIPIDSTYEPASTPMNVLPLFAKLDIKKQLQVFERPSKGHRKVVVSTNVAETSITIPGMRYVVDSGREKTRSFDIASGSSEFTVQWVAQSSASQRLGRAGRTGPGHCYRLYSSAVYSNLFKEHSTPEILRVPVDDLVLYMKDMGIDSVEDFPFPSPPDQFAIKASVSHLVQLGLLSKRAGVDDASSGQVDITALGKRIAKLPLSARIGKILVLASLQTQFDRKHHDLVPHAIALAAIMTVPSPFSTTNKKDQEEEESSSSEESSSEEEEEQDQDKGERRDMRWSHPKSDMLGLLKVAGAVSYANPKDLPSFCSKLGLHLASVREMVQLRNQLAYSLAKERSTDKRVIREHQLLLCQPLKKLSEEQELLMQQLVVSGFVDKVVRKMPKEQALAVAQTHQRQLPSRGTYWPYESCDPMVGDVVYMNALSYCCTRDPKYMPDFAVFGEILVMTNQDQSRHVGGQVTCIDPHWLPQTCQGTTQVTIGEAVPFKYDKNKDVVMARVKPVFGPKRWDLPLQFQALSPSHDEETYKKWFLRFLLLGQVCESWTCVKAWLKSTPVLITKKVHMDKAVRRALLVVPLSRAELRSKWIMDGVFMQDELKGLVLAQYQDEFMDKWPELIMLS